MFRARSGSQPKPRLPTTPDLLDILRRQWLGPRNPEYITLWAAACTGFFGFLRAGEFTVPTVQSYDPEVHLSLCDLALDSHSAPSLIRLRIKQNGSIPSGGGRISWSYPFLPVSRAGPDKLLSSPLFVFQSGSPLTRSALVSHLQSALDRAGISSATYTGQLPYWRSYHCCKTGRGGLTYPVTGSMEECGIPGLHKNPTPGTGVSGKGHSGRHQPIPFVLCLRVLNSLRGQLTMFLH